MTIPTHNDDVGFPAFCLCNQSGRHVTVAALDAMEDGIDAVVLEMIDGAGAHHCILFGQAVVRHDHYSDLCRLLQKGHALCHRPG